MIYNEKSICQSGYHCMQHRLQPRTHVQLYKHPLLFNNVKSIHRMSEVMSQN